ncbi:DUF2946 domain-containing protein [Silvimonas amylolytica]|uniref:DUF2946 domain-containing protein n=1 Tax=Silvimonas amylolytica TaxID=449663 RepID=A0ABQ2PSJ6_9NEIS|nr:DUF2946 domain-containing protein [Silvimonas amylolytica]GGP27952.1 hypothetical protein GCM10010971_37710 [Silvimonas amylolytica]
MNLRTRKLLAVWLGLIAMSLFVLAPVVSQLLMAGRSTPMAVAMCSVVSPHSEQLLDHGTSPDAMAACDYCTLQATHLLLPTLPHVAPSAVPLVAVLQLPHLRVRAIEPAVFPLARTRAPPHASALI